MLTRQDGLFGIAEKSLTYVAMQFSSQDMTRNPCKHLSVNCRQVVSNVWPTSLKNVLISILELMFSIKMFLWTVIALKNLKKGAKIE